MTRSSDEPFTLAFVGYATPETSERARAYEDAVLPLLADHGAELVYRGRRAEGQDADLPLEVHLIRFPHRDALASYLTDDRRTALVAQFGDVFTTSHAVEMETVSGPPRPANLVPAPAGDTRAMPPLVGDERQILTAYLDWHRQTFELKCAGVPLDRLSDKGIPPSGLSLHGLARHLAGVERWWFRIQFAGEDVPLLYYSDDDPEQDFERLDGDVAEALAVWRNECERSRAIVAATPSLDDTGTHAATGNPVSLRRVLVNLIAEYARHNGHADLLRERIDGATGL